MMIQNNLLRNYQIYCDVELDSEEVAFISLPADHRIETNFTKDDIGIGERNLVTKIRFGNRTEDSLALL